MNNQTYEDKSTPEMVERLKNFWLAQELMERPYMPKFPVPSSPTLEEPGPGPGPGPQPLVKPSEQPRQTFWEAMRELFQMAEFIFFLVALVAFVIVMVIAPALWQVK